MKIAFFQSFAKCCNFSCNLIGRETCKVKMANKRKVYVG